MTHELTDSNFQEQALGENTIAVVDFWAEWCGPCRLVGPVVESLSDDYEGKVMIGKLNVDNNQEVSMKYGIRSIPTILFLKNGEVFDKHVGTATKATLAAKIDAMLK